MQSKDFTPTNHQIHDECYHKALSQMKANSRYTPKNLFAKALLLFDPMPLSISPSLRSMADLKEITWIHKT